MTLTERINQLLTKMIKEEKRITQAELAERVGVAPASVNKWLNGGAPAVDKLPLLCEIFDISPNQLFGYESEYPIEAVELFRAFQCSGKLSSPMPLGATCRKFRQVRFHRSNVRKTHFLLVFLLLNIPDYHIQQLLH